MKKKLYKSILCGILFSVFVDEPRKHFLQRNAFNISPAHFHEFGKVGEIRKVFDWRLWLMVQAIWPM